MVGIRQPFYYKLHDTVAFQEKPCSEVSANEGSLSEWVVNHFGDCSFKNLYHRLSVGFMYTLQWSWVSSVSCGIFVQEPESCVVGRGWGGGVRDG